MRSPRLRSASSSSRSRELLRLARAGDRQALDQLFAQYLPSLHRFAHRRVPGWARNAADTGDLVQDAVVETFRHLQSFEPQGQGALLGYLRRSLLNRIRSSFRHAARHPTAGELNDAFVDCGASPLAIAIDRENRERYRAALTRLRPIDRDAIVGRVELGYNYQQLALVLKKPSAEAARLAVRRALLRLRDEMGRG